MAKGPSDGKSFKEVAAPAKPKLNEQGLYFFSLFNVAPKFQANLPFYFHTGLVYKGLIPTRDNDQFGIAFAYGDYSSDKQEVDASRFLMRSDITGHASQAVRAAEVAPPPVLQEIP